MNNKFSTFLNMVFETLPHEDWAAACVSLLLSQKKRDLEWMELYDYIEKILRAKIFSIDPCFDRGLGIGLRYISEVKAQRTSDTQLARVPVPSRLRPLARNICISPQDIRDFFDIKESEGVLPRLVKNLGKYINLIPAPTVSTINSNMKNGKSSFVCGVQPYIDTIQASLVIYMVSDLLESEKLIFEIAMWDDVPNRVDQKKYHLCYSSKNTFLKGHYHFSPVKDQSTRVPCVKYAFENKYTLENYNPKKNRFFNALNLLGYYAGEGENFNSANIEFAEGERLTYTTQNIENALRKEIEQLLQMASGLSEFDGIILSNSGFLWAIENGLMYKKINDDFDIGALLIGTVKKKEMNDPIGFGLQIQDGGDFVADEIITDIKNIMNVMNEKYCELKKLNQPKEYSRLFNILRTPMVFADRNYSSALTEISPSLALRMAFKDGDLYEREISFQPTWHEKLINAINSASVLPALKNG